MPTAEPLSLPLPLQPEQRDSACCFSGHRVLPSHEKEALARRLWDILVRLIEERDISVFYAGGALGFDMLAAQTVLLLKRQYPQIRLHLVLPCPEQAERWNAQSASEYRRILREADHVEYVAPAYAAGCMHERNRRLVRQSKYCVYYMTKSAGGTAYTVSRAEKEGLALINIAHLNS